MRLEAVSKRYGLRQPWVVRQVSLDVPAGRLIRLEGVNGSGKSTLLRVAAGVIWPSAGRVTGRPRTGYVPERFPGALAFSAREYLDHLSRVHGLRGPEGPARVTEWLDRLGAADYAGAPLRTLSKGMCQKVAVAQALLARPGLLILDEAWTGLDQAARVALDEAVTERIAAGGSVLFVDHSGAQLAGRISERWLFGGGQVTVQPGSPAHELPGQDRPGHNRVSLSPASPRHDPASPGRGGHDQEAGPAEGAVMVIEVSGLAPAALRDLPGVLAMSGPGPDGRLTARIRAGASDQVLADCLAQGGHISSVRPAGDEPVWTGGQPRTEEQDWAGEPGRTGEPGR